MSSFKHYLLILAISLLPFVIIIANPDLPHTSDGGVHLPRIAAYVKALADGHFPVRWAGDLNYEYGLPLFNFIYHTPYLLASLFVALGSSLVFSFKLVLMMSFLLSGVFMYSFAKELLKNNNKAFLIALFYQFAPFRLVELLVRGSIGSAYAYTFLPLVLLGIVRLTKKPTVPNIALTALATALLITSHNSLSLVFFALTVVSLLILSPSKKYTRIALFALASGLALSAFYWVPALLEHRYTYGNLFMKNLYKDHFPPLINFFIPNFTNDIRLRTAEISVQLGLFHGIGFFLALYVLLRKKIQRSITKKLFLFSLVLTITTFFFMQPISRFFWENVNILRQFQFPWRLLAVTTFTTSILSLSYLEFSFFKKPFVFTILCSLVTFSTLFYWYPPQGFDQVNEKDFWNYPLNTTYFGETDVIWSAGPAKDYPKERIEVISGQATVSNFSKITQRHTFLVDAKSEARLVDHTQFFPGWRVYIDNTQVPIQFQDPNHRGLITFDMPKGNHSVRVIFGESKTRAIADTISIATLTGLISLALWRKNKRLI